MTRLAVAALAAAALSSAGCATVAKPLDPARGAAFREQPVTYTVRAKPGFSAVTAGKAMAGGLFGAIGGAIAGSSMIDAGNELVAKHGIDDPADAISLELARALEATWGTKLVTPPYVDGAAFQVNAAAERAPYRIDVRTTGWGFAYFAGDWSHYGAVYRADAALVERASGEVLAEASCSQGPVKEGAPTYDELLADGAARLKRQLQGAAAGCLGVLKQQLFRPGTLKAVTAVAAAAAPAPGPTFATATAPPPVVPPAVASAGRPNQPPAVAVAPPPPAAAPKVRWRGPASAVFELGYDFGSTKLSYVDISDGSRQWLKANRGFWMSAGAAFLKAGVGQVGLETAATVGFKYSRIGVEKDGIRYLAFPLEVVERATVGPVRLGLGASIALNPSIQGEGRLDTSDFDVDLANSLGVLFQLDILGNRAPYRDVGWVVGVRFLWQKLGEQTLRIPVDANSVGLTFGWEL